jgi:phospholipid/cholesterol/gamma-HCH transport system substrate-binding protein
LQQFIKVDAVASIGSDGLVGDKVLIIEPGSSSKSIVTDNGMIASNSTIEIEDVMKSVKKSAENAEIITHQLARFSLSMNDSNGLLSKLMIDKKFANSIDKTFKNIEISTAEIVKFSPKLNDPNGIINRLLVDKNFAINMDNTLSNLQKSSADLALFTSKINNDSNVLSKLIDNQRLGNSLDSTITKIEIGTQGIIEIENAVKSNFLLRGYFNRKKRNEEKKK